MFLAHYHQGGQLKERFKTDSEILVILQGQYWRPKERWAYVKGMEMTPILTEE